MWTDCPVMLDEPVTICGVEPEDFGLIAVTPLFASFFLAAAPSLLLAGALGVALSLAKRGQPPGALLHALHGLELTRLPGLLAPRRQRYSAW
jgi:hypothetical protein